MKKNKLGTSTLEVSKVCLGTMTFGEQNSPDESFDQMTYAFENGINFFDTAEMYPIPGRKHTQGNTERIIGDWLEESGNREEIYIATKVSGPGLNWIRKGTKFSKDQIHKAVDDSLKRLKVDSIDLYQLHWPERGNNKFGHRIYPWHINEGYKHNFMAILEALVELLESGKIKNWGLSNETSWGIMKFMQLCDQYGITKPVSVQNAYSLMNRLFEYGASEVAQFENIGLMAYSPLAFGLLSGGWAAGVPQAGRRSPHLRPPTEQARRNRRRTPRQAWRNDGGARLRHS